jgi:3-isopropylmalate/(R)-2-methylmalate dehydratase large subunit
MGLNAVEKILARHTGQTSFAPGDVVMAEVDLAVFYDAMRTDIRRIHDPKKVVLLHDHHVPYPTAAAANRAATVREFAERFGVETYFPVGRHGIAHVLLAEEGLALPGMTVACGDSHTCSSGALNCLARGMGGLEMMHILCKGTGAYVIGPTVRIELTGTLGERVYPRDVIHHIPGRYGDFAGQNLEWYGDGLAGIDMDGRLTMATISAELSADFSLFPYDGVLEAYLDGRARQSYEPAFPDPDATYDRTIEIDMSSLGPQVVLPDKVAWNVEDVGDVVGQRIDQAFIGSCANGRLSDFAVAAEIVKGHKVAAGTRFLVTPGSQRILKEAMRAGYVETLMEAGAVVTSSTCGACYGGHMGLVGDEEVCLTASTRNFKGRMGSPSARVFMASPATVAASAIRGVITDPRDL